MKSSSSSLEEMEESSSSSFIPAEEPPMEGFFMREALVPVDLALDGSDPTEASPTDGLCMRELLVLVESDSEFLLRLPWILPPVRIGTLPLIGGPKMRRLWLCSCCR